MLAGVAVVCVRKPEGSDVERGSTAYRADSARLCVRKSRYTTTPAVTAATEAARNACGRDARSPASRRAAVLVTASSIGTRLPQVFFLAVLRALPAAC